MSQDVAGKIEVSAMSDRNPNADDLGVQFHNFWKIECRKSDGTLRWEDKIDNLVVNAGLNYILSAGIGNGTKISTWHVGLTGNTPTINAADTIASHAGWTEVVNYTESVRQAYSPAASGQTLTNTANKAVFNINSNSVAVGGAFIVSDNMKNGTAGTLYGVGAFSGGNKTVDNGDVLNITVVCSASSS